VVGADRVAEALQQRTGWRLLRDELATVEVGGARLHVNRGLGTSGQRRVGAPREITVLTLVASAARAA
jgi:predicted MPP superfamily phosphohydrolase